MTTQDYTPEQLPLPFTITIPLTKGYSTVIDAVDADLADLKWFSQVSPHTCYARRTKRIDERGKSILLHQLILSRMLGRDLVKGECVDHIDGSGLNNRRDNLRLATRAENPRNRRLGRDNTSGYKGAIWRNNKKKWSAQIRIDGKLKHLGYFDTPVAAHKAYCEAAQEYFGEFARFE